jgi:flagellar biosynthesis protein FlhG
VSRPPSRKMSRPDVRLVPAPVTAAPAAATEHPAQWSRPRAHTIVVASGKGGVGKSNLAVNVAMALGARGARVLLLDGDLAQANLDLLLGVHPRFDLQHVLAGQKTLDEIVVNGPTNVRLVPAASGVPELADLDDYRRELLLRSLSTLEPGADVLLIDTASGVSRQTTEFCRIAHDVLVVTTPELPAFSDAYALIKLLQKQGSLARAPRLVVNMSTGAEDAEDTAHRIRLVARRFLQLELDFLGVVPLDPHVPRAVRLQEPVLAAFPKSPAAAAYRALAAMLWKPVSTGPSSDVAAEHPQRLEA